MEDAHEIYLITCKTAKKKYIGQTVSFSKKKDGTFVKKGTYGRWKTHVYSRNNKTSRCRLLADAIAEYGENDFIVETLLIINQNKINFYEKLFIKTYNTIHPNGYNLLSGGSSGGRHNDETKKLIGESNTGKVRTEEYKKEMSKTKMIYKGLPEYIYVLNDSKRNTNGYRVMKHPILPEKKFSSKLLTMEQKLQQAIDYVNGIQSSIEIPKNKHDEQWKKNVQEAWKRKKEANLPQYIYETNDTVKNSHGYIVKNHPILNKKQFVSQKLSMEEKLQLAMNYLTLNDIGSSSQAK